MHNQVVKTLLLASLLGFSILLSATPPTRPGGGGGGTGSSCGIICRFIYGSCEIPSGDPDVPPLRDPFCEARLNACIASCSGGVIGGIRLGYPGTATRSDWQWSPVNSSQCALLPLLPEG
jgi:hypothetical protein